MTEKPKTIRLAGRAFCIGCMGGESVPGVREQVRGCTAKTCALHPWRPFRFKGELTPAQVAYAARTGDSLADSEAGMDADDSADSEDA